MSAIHADTGAQQGGVALVTMLLLIALLTAIVSRLGLSSTLWLRQVENGSTLARAAQANRAAQSWVARFLEEDSAVHDGFTDTWARSMPPVPLAGGFVDGWIEDMQGRFNVNNLVDANGKADPRERERFERLLRVLQLDTGIAQSTIDWIDRDDEASGPWGAESGYYMGMDPPYVTANRPMLEVDEMRLVRGVSKKAWARLAPHLAALPGKTVVNVNTATGQVLAAVVTRWGAAGSAVGRADRWLKQAAVEPVNDIGIFVEKEMFENPGEKPEGLGVASRYFMAHIRLALGDFSYRTATLYRRVDNRADIIWQRRELL